MGRGLVVVATAVGACGVARDVLLTPCRVRVRAGATCLLKVCVQLPAIVLLECTHTDAHTTGQEDESLESLRALRARLIEAYYTDTSLDRAYYKSRRDLSQHVRRVWIRAHDS